MKTNLVCCPSCGTEHSTRARTCSKCGARVALSSPTPKGPALKDPAQCNWHGGMVERSELKHMEDRGLDICKACRTCRVCEKEVDLKHAAYDKKGIVHPECADDAR